VRYLIDENLPIDLVEFAQHQGVEAVWVRHALPAAKDSVILERLHELGEVLVTRDIGFANLVFRRMITGYPLAGAVLIREERMYAIREAWQRYLALKPPSKSLVVVTSKGARIRTLQNDSE
jgi:hypothetical protein